MNLFERLKNDGPAIAHSSVMRPFVAVCVWGLMAGLAACVSTPFVEDRAKAEPAPQSTGSNSADPKIADAVPVTVPPSEAPSPDAGAESTAVVELISAPEPDVAEPTRVPPDLFDRIRAGLALRQPNHNRIDSEANWFANNPEYIERTFTRAAPYLHYIVGEVEARGLPMELALLPIIESAFEPYAYSSARAAGLWQFIPSTGSRFSLKQNWWYDGRRDVIAATQGALDYLQYLHRHFDGDWLLAIGAYNTGEGNVGRSVRRNRSAGRSIDFFSLRLPAETRGYVPRLLAMARVVAQPERYGLVIEGFPDEPFFRRVETGGQISMEVASELAGVSLEEMYLLNAAHHRWATDPAGPHSLLVPVESADAFTQGLLLLTPDQRLRAERYEVRSGDTATSVAARFGTTTQHLREMNGLDMAETLQAGSEIRVPSAVSQLPEKVRQAAARVDRGDRGASGTRTVRAVHVVRRGESLWTISRRHGMTVAQLTRLNGLTSRSTLRPGQRLRLSSGSTSNNARTARADSASSNSAAAETGTEPRRITYVVRRGDTLSAIARSLRVTVSSLRSWNDLTSNALLRPGQRLVAFVNRGG